MLGSSVQFSSVAQSCPNLCNPMNGSMPGLPAHHQLPEFTKTHAHSVDDAIQPVIPLSTYPQFSLASGSFQMSQLFTSGDQSIGISASASVLSMNSGLISFRMDWLDLLAVQGAPESSSTAQFKSINSSALSFL